MIGTLEQTDNSVIRSHLPDLRLFGDKSYFITDGLIFDSEGFQFIANRLGVTINNDTVVILNGDLLMFKGKLLTDVIDITTGQVYKGNIIHYSPYSHYIDNVPSSLLYTLLSVMLNEEDNNRAVQSFNKFSDDLSGLKIVIAHSSANNLKGLQFELRRSGVSSTVSGMDFLLRIRN